MGTSDGCEDNCLDGGPQFFVRQAGLTDVRTMAYHPQSNGRDEWLHRTIREEVSVEPDDTLYQVQELIASFRRYYNEQRLHSALHYLRPMNYYRGNPAARLAEREAKLRQAAEVRKRYGHALGRPMWPASLSISTASCLIAV